MSAQRTKFPKNPVPARRMHQATTIVGKNGLPVDALITIEPGSTLIKGNTAITYNAPTITFDAGVDLSSLANFSAKVAKHTGTLIFTDSSNNSYFIDKDSIDNINKTIDIYNTPDFDSSPNTLGLGISWSASEAELVNRLQTTTTAVVDSVEFRDVEVKVDLDGSTVNIKDDEGDQLEINSDGSINVNVISTDSDAAELNNIFGQVSSLSNSTPTTVVSYTAPADTMTFLQKIFVAGTNVAKYEVRLNGTPIDRTYTYFSGPLSSYFDFLGPPSENGQELNPGDIITVIVEHSRPMVGDFNARIQVLEIS